MVPDYWNNVPTIMAYVIIFAMTCLTTATSGSVLFDSFSRNQYQPDGDLRGDPVACTSPHWPPVFLPTPISRNRPTRIVNAMTITSPFAAAFNFPIYMDDHCNEGSSLDPRSGCASVFGYPLVDLRHFAGYLSFSVLFNVSLLGIELWMFNSTVAGCQFR